LAGYTRIHAAFQDRRIIAAYGDTLSDLPMLEMSENPIAIYPDAGLRKLAESRGWQMIDESCIIFK
jgi:phosphoserine phosphatase